jgi:hypothetical protein
MDEEQGLGWFGGAILIVLIFLAWNNWLKPLLYPTWTATYYYEQGDLSRYRQAFNLKSVDSCRTWVTQQAYSLGDTNYDYECGKNCKVDSSGGPSICDETVK